MASQEARVLVVDDDRLIRELVADLLAEDGLRSALASSGTEGLQLAGEPDVGVVVLDVELPDISGLQVFRRLRDERPDLRVIVISGNASQAHVMEALRLGAFDYLAKPLHEEELRLAVRRALASHVEAAARQRLERRLRALGPLLESMWERARVEEDGTRALREAVVHAAAEIAAADRISLMLLDADGVALRLAAVRGAKLDPERLEPVPLGEGVAGVACARGEPLVVADVEQDERFAGRAPADRYRSRSFAVVPLIAEGRAFGVLCATEPRGRAPLGNEDASLLRVLAAQVAPLLDAGRRAARRAAEPAPLEAVEALPEEPEAADAELARDVCDAITAEAEPARVLAGAVAAAARVLGAAPVSIYVAEEGGTLLRREAEGGRGLRTDREQLPRGRGLAGGAFETGQLVATHDPAADPRFDAAVDTPADGRAGPLLCGALRFRGERLGLFRAFLPAGASASARTAEVLAASFSAALRNALLYRSLIDSIEEVARVRRESR